MNTIANAAGLLYRTGLEMLAEYRGTHPTSLVALNAWPHPSLGDLARNTGIDLWQHRRSVVLELEGMGLNAAPPTEHDTTMPETSNTDMALVLADRQRAQTLGWTATALDALQPEGLLLFCAANALGARGFERRLRQVASVAGMRAGAKSRCLILRKSDVCDRDMLARWREEALPRRQPDTGLWTLPGIFGWKRADAGSRLLAACLPGNLAGRGMDLGCGTGFLADCALRACANITEVHLVDDDAMALACARRNLNARMKTIAAGIRIHVHWLDATREALPDGLDWVLLNPPFHTAGQRNTALGQQMIEAGCRSLRPDGRLFMVANRKLPYESVLDARLKRWRPLHEGDGFKVIEGVR